MHFQRFNFHMYNFYIYQNESKNFLVTIRKQNSRWRMNIRNERFEEEFTNETTSTDRVYKFSFSRFLQRQNSISLCALVIFRTTRNNDKSSVLRVDNEEICPRIT